MIQYIPFTVRVYSDEIGEYSACGIRAVDQRGACLAEIGDVSADCVFVGELCRRFTELELDPVHLADAVEDAIAEI